ncbi:MAG TPA: FliH/SctL family protein [Tepidisphaeraceae bacterium]|jgi:flagellar assembly protein FliH
MGLIKANNVPSSASPFSMRDIEHAAKMVLVRAQRQAEQLLMEAQAGAQELRQAGLADGAQTGQAEGYQKGFDEGLIAGHQQALADHTEQLTNVFNALTTALQQIEASRRELETSATRQVIDLAVAIARRVTKRQGAVDPAVASANVQEALKLVVHSSDVRIAIHPAQKQSMLEELPKLKMQWPALSHIEVIEDDSLAPGGCRILTQQGQIDGDLDTQLDRIVRDLVPGGGEN